jgi:iodotyrosine deiodinase
MDTPTYRTTPLGFERLPEVEMLARGSAFLAAMRRRRSVREFAPDAVPRAVIETAIAAAHTAPSGANRQPWHFVAVAAPALKHEIRVAAEAEEREFYERRATPEWLADLAPLGTDWRKPFLETAPLLIVVFALDWEEGLGPDGARRRRKNYYVQESVGIAVGLLLAALHAAGLVTLTHTPSPMGFLGTVLGRPRNERAYVLLPVGYPAPDATVPDLGKKSLEEVRTLV